MKRSRLLLALGWFLAGVIFAIGAPKLLFMALNRVILPEQRHEVSRVTSPDAVVDAVMIRSECGAPCSTNYSVFIVPKGNQVQTNSASSIFSADDMFDQRLTWKQAHLLEIGYSKAFIISFQNVSYPFKNPAKNQSSMYRVEVRLSPTSQGFSYLKEADIQ